MHSDAPLNGTLGPRRSASHMLMGIPRLFLPRSLTLSWLSSRIYWIFFDSRRFYISRQLALRSRHLIGMRFNHFAELARAMRSIAASGVTCILLMCSRWWNTPFSRNTLKIAQSEYRVCGLSALKARNIKRSGAARIERAGRPARWLQLATSNQKK